MIEVGDVLASYDGLIDGLFDTRSNLVVGIYKLTKNMSLEDSNLSKEALLRIKFIVSIHDEILKNIEKEQEDFKNKPEYLQKRFYRNVEFAKIYSDVVYFQSLIIENEGLKNCISDLGFGSNNLELLKSIDNWVYTRLLINEFELDIYEEDIATRFTKILEKGKER